MSFPSSLPSYAGFTSTHTLQQDNHAAQHNQEQTDITAIATKVGTGASTPTNDTVLRGNGTGTTTYDQVHLATDISGILPAGNGGTGITSLGPGIATFLGAPSSSNLATALTDETGTGSAVFANNPTLSQPTISDFTNAQHNHQNTSGGGSLNGGLALQPGTLTHGVLGTDSSWAAQSWVPTWTNLTVSGSTVTAQYIQIGKFITFEVTVTLGGSNAPTGAVSFSLPVTSISYPGTSTLPVLGDAKYFITNAFRGSVVWVDINTARFVADNTAGTYSTDANISSSVPGNFINGSELHGHGWYWAA